MVLLLPTAAPWAGWRSKGITKVGIVVVLFLAASAVAMLLRRTRA